MSHPESAPASPEPIFTPGAVPAQAPAPAEETVPIEHAAAPVAPTLALPIAEPDVVIAAQPVATEDAAAQPVTEIAVSANQVAEAYPAAQAPAQPVVPAQPVAETYPATQAVAQPTVLAQPVAGNYAAAQPLAPQGYVAGAVPTPAPPAYVPGQAPGGGYGAPVGAAPGYAPVSAVPGYAPVSAVPGYGYPVSAMPYGAPQAPFAQPKKSKAGVIVLSIITALLVLATGGVSTLYFVEKSERTASDKVVAEQKATLAGQKTELEDLKAKVQAGKDELTKVNQELTGTKNNAAALQKCLDALDAFFSNPTSAKGKAVDKACEAYF